MGDENKEGTVDWKAKYEQVFQEKATVAKELDGLKARLGKYESGMRKQVEDRLFRGLVDPDIRTLAPKIEIDPESGDITAVSAEAFNKWRAAKSHFFVEDTAENKAEKGEEKKEEKAPEQRPGIPPSGGAGKRSVAWFEELEKNNYEEWSRPEVQKAYIRALDEEDRNSKR